MGRDSDVPGDEEGSGSVEGRHSEDKTGGAGMAPRQKSTRINTGLALFPMVMMLIMLSTCNLGVSTMCATCAPSMPALIGAWEPRYTI